MIFLLEPLGAVKLKTCYTTPRTGRVTLCLLERPFDKYGLDSHAIITYQT